MRDGRKRFSSRAGLWLLGTVSVLTVCGLTGVTAQRDMSAPTLVLVVSKPPPRVVPSDPPGGLVFGLRPDMRSSSVTFDASEGAASLEYLHFDDAGNAYLTFDDGPVEAAPGGVMVLDSFLTRDGGGFDASRDRLVTGSATSLIEPKDLSVAPELGVFIVADFGGAKLVTFDTTASGDAAPLFVTTDLGVDAAGEPRRPWGLAFDAAADRLFVGSTDGTVLVFDHYLVNRGERGPDRVITPTLDGERVSANTHDLVYVEEGDLLIASDVGSATTAEEPNFDTDGSVFVITDASAAAGETEVQVQVAGPNTMLGNPVGLAFDGTNLFVTEKTKDVVLRFDDLLEGAQRWDIAPSGAVTVAQPEAVVLAPEGFIPSTP